MLRFKFVILILFLFSFKTFAFENITCGEAAPSLLFEDFLTDSQKINDELICLIMPPNPPIVVDDQKLKLSISGNASSGKFELTIEDKYPSRHLDEVVDNLTNPTIFNKMFEAVKSAEDGQAYQDTVKIGKGDAYILETDAGGTILGMKVSVGKTKSICAKVKVGMAVRVACQNDAKDESTKKLINSSLNETTCTQVGADVKCLRHILVDAKSFSKFGQNFSGYEVAFRSGLSAVRSNLGLSNLTSTINAEAAYARYNCSPTETRVAAIIANYERTKAYTPINLDL